MTTVTRADLAKKIASSAGLTASESYKMVDLFFNEISTSLIRGENVKITGMGTFKILDKAQRIGRNPKTGVPAIISARRVVSFKPSTEFRKKVSGN